MRKFWRNLHLWLGLSAGMVLVLIGLTGSAIVFYRVLEEQIYTSSLLVEPREAPRISIEDALRTAVARHPDGTVLGVKPPRHEKATYLAHRYFPDGEGDFHFTFISIHPYTGEILGEREFGKTVMTFLYSLHYTLTIGEAGSFIVGFIGIFFLVSIFTGLYLWWPKNGKWKQALWFKKGASGHRRNFDIHRVFGFYPSVIFIVIAFSGVYMIFPEQVKPLVGAFLPVRAEDEFHFKEALAPKPELSYEQVTAIARRVFPGSEITGFDRPHDAKHPFTVAFADADQPMTSYGYNMVSIHPHSGDIVDIRSWDKTPAGSALLAWQYPLHNGEAFGLVGRWIIFFLGFLPAVLYVTGLSMWLKRRRKSTHFETGLRLKEV